MRETNLGQRSSSFSKNPISNTGWLLRWMFRFGLLPVFLANSAFAQEKVAVPADIVKPAEKVEKKEAPAKDKEAKQDKVKQVPAKTLEDVPKKPEKPKKQLPANPINRLIQGIFGGAKPPARIIPQNPQNAKPPGAVKEPANGDEQARDRVDARAPYDPQMAKMLRRAAAHMEKARAEEDDREWNLALDILKFVLDPVRPGKPDQPVEDALVRGTDGKWTTMRQEANRLLAEFPPEQLAAYRQEFGGLAKVMLNEAKAQGNIDQIVTVATQFFQTPAGTEAANWMGMRHFDHGEFGMAARWFRQLLKHEIPITKNPQWQLKAAVTFHQAGDKKASEELLQQLAGHSLSWGGKTLAPKEFVAQLTTKEGRIPTLDDWPMLYGSASHLGKARGGDPLLLSRWFQPLTSSHKAIEMIDELVDDLIDEQFATVPAFTPIMVNGKAIFRTLRGVRVTDVQTGQTLWETRAGISPERLITGIENSQPEYAQEMGFFGGGGRQVYYNGSGSGVDNHKLTSLLFRNGTWGGISSDGGQLFVLEDHAILLPYDPGNYWAVQNGISDQFRRDYSTNKIVSYNLETGRPRWEIGGTAMDEPFDRRLAGEYFFGVPVADQDDLFVIGERDNEIRLFALDKDTGRPKWSQLTAYSDAKIERDFGRRWWNAQVGVGQGVIVCPTTVGWLVGIDRLNRSVLWAYRYSKATKGSESNPFNNGQDNSLVTQSPLNAVWGPSAPIIAGHRVVYTPPEDDILICLDLFTGEKLWSKQKEDHLYLAGVFEGQTILVGKSKISAISLESGSTLWTLPLTQDDGKPCGMGVAVGKLYHLPLSSGQLWSVDLANGKVKSKAMLPDGLPQLGNLGMYRGMLLSLGPHGMAAFSQQQAIEQEIAARRKKNPHDPWALLFESNIHSLKQEYQPALNLLRQAKPDQLPADLKQRYRKLMIEDLTAVIQSDFKKGDSEYAELKAFVKSDEEQLAFRRLTADRLRARGDYQAAFEEYLALAESKGQLQMTRDDDPRITLSMDRWLTGRLEKLWREVSGEDRAKLDERIAAVELEAAESQGVERSQRFLVLFGFHPQAVNVRRALVEEFALAGEVALAQNQLLKLSRDSDKRTAAMALERLARLFRDRGLPRDANYYYQRLAECYPEVPLADGKLVSAKLEEWKAAGTFGSVAAHPVSWSDAKIEELRTGTNYSYYGNPEHDLQYTPYRLPYFQDRRFRFFQGHQRLGMSLAATDEIEWLVPLRQGVSNSQGNFMPAETSGHLLFVVHAGILHALSPVDRKILWTRPLDPKGGQNTYYNANQAAMQPMQRSDQLSPYTMLSQQQNTMLAVANSDYVCVLGRRMLSVHDSVTGRLRWSKDRLPHQARVYGTDSLVFIVPQVLESGKIIVLSSIDGSQVEVPNVKAILQKTMRILPAGFILAETKASQSILGLKRGTASIRFFDPSKNRDVWKKDYPNGTYLSLMDDNFLAALKPTGELELLDLETGNVRAMQGARRGTAIQNGSPLRHRQRKSVPHHQQKTAKQSLLQLLQRWQHARHSGQWNHLRLEPQHRQIPLEAGHRRSTTDVNALHARPVADFQHADAQASGQHRLRRHAHAGRR